MPRPPAPIDTNTVLAEITSAMVGEFQLPVLLERVVQTVMNTLGAKVCSVFLEDSKERDVLLMMAGSGFAKPLVGKARYRIGEGFTGTVAKTGQKFNIRNREELEELEVDGQRVWQGRFDSAQWPSGHSEFENLIALPLRIKDHVLGVIKVENKRAELGACFSEDDVRYFETIANVVALVIENALLHQRIELQLKTIAAKAAHRIGNLATDYDGIEAGLSDEVDAPVADRQHLDDLVNRIKLTTKNLKTLARDITTFGKPLVINPIPTDINKVINDEIWLAGPPSIVSIGRELDQRLPAVAVDARFAEAMKELLRNAMKALSKKGGTITIKTCCLDNSTKGRCIRIEVSDTGPGFPPGLAVFEPFISTDPMSTGLGLVTVRELIEAHGGLVDAYNQAEGGVSVVLLLPVGEKEG